MAVALSRILFHITHLFFWRSLVFVDEIGPIVLGRVSSLRVTLNKQVYHC